MSEQQDEKKQRIEDEPLFIPGSNQNEYEAPPRSEAEEPEEAGKTPIGRFFYRYFYQIIKLYLNQFAIGLFGAGLAIATAKTKGALFYTTGVISILFYAVLVYSVMWNIGAKDRISVDVGKRRRNLGTGFAMGIFASVPSFLIAILYSIGAPFMNTQEWAGNLCGLMRVLALFSEGMYWWIISSVELAGRMLLEYPLTYLLITVPPILIIGFSYMIGYSGWHLTNIFVDRSAEMTEAAKRKKQEKKDYTLKK